MKDETALSWDECYELLDGLFCIVTEMVTPPSSSFSAACRKRGIDWCKARGLLKSKSFRCLRAEGRELTVPVEDACGTGYELLYADVFGITPSEIGEFELPPDAEETVDYVLNELKVSDRYKDIAARYYGLNGQPEETYDEIAKVYGVTRSRISQMHHRLIRILRYPPRARILKAGAAKYKAIDEINAAAQETFEQEIARLRAEAIENAKLQAQQQAEKEQQAAEQSICHLDLSVRTYNCLHRAGVMTVGQLTELSDDDMRHIRNLGKHSIAEIHQKLESYLGGKQNAIQ